MSGDDTPRRREVAHRLFAAEFDDADLSYAESDEERAPNYVVTPTGARVNRVFVVGVLTAVERAGEDILRARVVDPTGAFVVYAGQYQPDAQTFFERADPPAFVAVTGKARTFQPEDGDRVYTSVRPESVNEVDAETRDRWTVGTAERTLDRVGAMAGALRSDERGEDLRAALEAEGVEESLAAGVPIAIDHYATTGEYLAAVRDLALDAARVVTGEIEEVEPLTVSPGQGSHGDLAALSAVDVGGGATGTVAGSTEPSTADAAEGSAVGTAESATTSGAGTADAATTATADEGDASAEDLQAADESLGDSTTAVTEDVGDFDPGEFELDDDEREEIEAEFGTEFRSGTDVDEPGEADIETPDPGNIDAAAGDSDTGTTVDDADGTPVDTDADDTTADAGGEQADGPDEAGEADGPADVDPADAVMDAMVDLDDGSGADREAVIAEVVETHGLDPGDVEDAIQDALMDGRCYEPDDETLKPI